MYKVNILHISRTMGQGGAEKIVYQLATAGSAKGQHVTVASTGGKYVEMMEKVSHTKIYDLECKNPLVILKNLFSLAKIIKKQKIQIIHSHHRMAACYAVILRMFFPKVRLVYTAHNVFYDKQKLTRLSLRNTKIVAVGNSVRENLMKEFQIDEKQIETIYNSVEVSEAQKEFQLPELEQMKLKGYQLVGAVGRLSEQKGMDVFVKALQLVKQQYPKVKGVIIGDGELRGEIEQLIREQNMTEDIQLLGYQMHVTDLIAQLDFLVMPSRWEGFPLTPIEAFAMKKTVVGSDIGGINEIVKNNESGILVAKDDVNGFADAILKCLQNEAFREKLEIQAKKSFEEKYHYSIFEEKYMRLYQQIIAEV